MIRAKKVVKPTNDSRKSTYEYKQLSKCEIGNNGVNFYGVVLDASFPHKSFKSDKFICSLRVAD
jgi:hypothetical protein